MSLRFMVAVCLAFAAVGCVPLGIPSDQYSRALSLIDQGTVQLRRGELVEARASYQMAYDLAHLAAGLDGLGCVAAVRGDYGIAEQYFKAAYEHDASYETAISNLALLYDLTGRTAEAEALYRQAVANEPLNIRARSNFGAFLSDSVAGGALEGETELLHAQALGTNPTLVENLKKVRDRYGEE